ncbi:MAG: hypothetical protein LC647_17995, partial [Beggiatoa sp.]|nr:hypothetical protein [Beggiatoa sp.]
PILPVGLGEDGPTHQSIEHAASLRLIPHLSVWRPCDLGETAVAWQLAIERRDGRTALLLTRQKVTSQTRTKKQILAMARGAYVLFDGPAPPEVILLATGSEVGLAMGAARLLTAEGRRVRVVSVPSVDAFEAQDQAYRDAVLPPAVRKCVAIEAGIRRSLVQVRRARRQGDRSVHLRSFGARRGGLRALRVHGGGHRPHPARVVGAMKSRGRQSPLQIPSPSGRGLG